MPSSLMPRVIVVTVSAVSVTLVLPPVTSWMFAASLSSSVFFVSTEIANVLTLP